MAKKSILVVSETIDIDSSSAGKGRVAFIQSLVKGDFNVDVLHYSHKKINLPSVKTVLVKENRADPYYWLSRGQRVIQRLTGKNFSRSLENIFGFSFTFKNDAASMARAILNYENEFDLIITLSKGASYRTHAALLFCPHYHHKWLAFVHDPYPFHLYPPPYNWTEAGHQQKEAFFKEVSEKAAFSSFPSLLLKEWMSTFFPNFSETGIVLPHQKLPSKEKHSVLPDNFRNDAFTILHSGNLLDHRNPFFLIEGYKTFISNNPEAAKKSQLLLIGDATPHEPSLTAVCDSVPTIYKSDGYMPFKEVQVLQQNATCLLVLEAISIVSPFLPGKFPHYIQENKPIIHLGPENSETRRLLGVDYPYSCAADDIVEIANIFNELFIDWQSGERLELNRPDLQEYCSESYFINQLNTILD
jgi:hypothetical protein